MEVDENKLEQDCDVKVDTTEQQSVMATCDVSVDQDSGKANVVWEYELTKGKWVRYNKAITEKLNASTGTEPVEVDIDESVLLIDCSKMKQRNKTSGYVRAVRCAIRLENVEDYYAWDSIQGRRWTSLAPENASKLEVAYKQGDRSVVVLVTGTQLTADLDANTLNSEDGAVKCKLRRGVSKADAAMSASPAPSAHVTRSLVKRGGTTDKRGDTTNTKKAKQDSDKSGDDKVTAQTDKKGKDKSAGDTNKSAKSKSQAVIEGKSQMRKVLLKGGAAVDEYCVEKVGVAHVFCQGNDIYDAMLNQTNTQNNNNKYYVIQLLEDDCQKRYSVWFRWGRVGYKGQTTLTACGNDLEKAKSVFCRKFYDKTQNDFSDRKEFTKVEHKYDYLPADYSKITEKENKKDDQKVMDVPPSKLDHALQRLLNLICDVRAMEETVMELEYDATKAPLGKVTEDQIKAGYSALKKIEDFIKKRDFSQAFVNAVNEYYTKVPHSFGMRQPPLIKEKEQLKSEMSLLEALSQIEVAIRTLNENDGDTTVNPLDRHYSSMHCDLQVLNSDHPSFKMVDNYLQWTHASTHNLYHMRIRNLFAVVKQSENESFIQGIGNRMLLWHGSRLSNWYGILSQGLRIAPPEAPVTGYMFGKGVYFADMSSKSANYCFPQKSKPGLMVLCEVALGNPNELLQANSCADKLPSGKHSVKGLGITAPDPSQFITLDDGCLVPCGKPVTEGKNRSDGYSLSYNEYIVYNTNQIRIKYLVEIDFLFDF